MRLHFFASLKWSLYIVEVTNSMMQKHSDARLPCYTGETRMAYSLFSEGLYTMYKHVRTCAVFTVPMW